MTAPSAGFPEAFEPDASTIGAALRLLIESRHASHEEGAETTPERVVAALPGRLPRRGIGPDAAIEQIGAGLCAAARFDDPVWAAHVDSPKPWLAWVGALWGAALGQDLARRRSAPIARLMEHALQGWLAPVWGMNAGMLVTDHAQANLTALWVARDGRGARRVVASEAAHRSVAKAATILGLQFVALPVGADERLDLDSLVDLARRDPEEFSRSAIVLCAGTPTTGAVDPLRSARRAVASIGASPGWWHVDTGWAGPLAFDRKSARRLAGIERADSMSTVLHALAFAPLPVAFAGFRDHELVRQALRFDDDEGDAQLGLTGGRGDVATGLVLMLLAYGSDGVADWIGRSLDRIADLAVGLREEARVDVYEGPAWGAVLWRPRDSSVEAVFDRLDSRCGSMVTVGGTRWIRHVIGNPMLNPELVLAHVRRSLP